MSTKSAVIIDLKFDPLTVAAALRGAFPGRETINLADVANAGRDLRGIDYAVVWKQDERLFERAPDLKVIFSGGAGVDHLMGTKDVPDLPIVRFVNRGLTAGMSEWVVLQCLMHLRQVAGYAAQRRNRIWGDLRQPEARDVTVGVMGLGVIGQDAAQKLRLMDFNVIGWSRSRKQIDGMETFDADELDSFLARTDILVGLLPLTPETTGLYDMAFFSRLRQGGALGKPVFINAGRGKSQNQADLLQALKNGLLGAASLDVFETEPLPQDDPLWDLDNLIITPHVAGVTDEGVLFRHVEAQIDRLERGEALEHLVDRAKGY